MFLICFIVLLGECDLMFLRGTKILFELVKIKINLQNEMHKLPLSAGT